MYMRTILFSCLWDFNMSGFQILGKFSPVFFFLGEIFFSSHLWFSGLVFFKHAELIHSCF